jgi:predicted SprT family Zn-dependent metalloprotease
MTDRSDILMEEDLNENDWEDVKARFHALKNGKYGGLWSQLAKETPVPRSPATALTEQVNGLSTARFAATSTATATLTPTNMQVTVMATTSSCRCGCTPKTNSFLPSDMLQQEDQPTATPATRWSPLLEDDDEEDEDEEDSDDEESGDEESPQFNRRVLEFDFENDTGVVGDEEGDDDNDSQVDDDGDESGDQDSDNSSSSGGSTVVAFNNVSFQYSPPSGDTASVEHQDGLRSEDTDPNVHASLPDPESPIYSSPTHTAVSSDALAGNLNDDDTGVVCDSEEAGIKDDTQAQKEDDDGGDEYGDQESENSSSSDDSTAVSFNNVSFYHSPASGGSVEHQDGLSSEGEDPNIAASLLDPRSPLFSPTTRASVSSDAAARSLNELPLRKPESPASGSSDEESVDRAGTLNESSLCKPDESSPLPESPGIAPPAQDAAIIDATTGALNALSLRALESPAQESSIVDAITTGTLNESSPTEPESPAFAPPAKNKEPEVIDLVDTSSDEERESSPVIASSWKASQAIELVSTSDEKLNELPKRRKKRFVARSPRPTLYDNSSSSSSEGMERNDARTSQSSFSDDNESGEEQSFQPTSSDYEKEDEDDDDSVEQLVQRTNKIVIDSDGDSNTKDDSAEALRPAKRPPRKPKAKQSVSKAAFRRSREAMGAETFVTFDNAAFGGRLGVAKVTMEWSKKLRTTAGMTRLCKTKRPGCTPVLTASIELSTKVIDDPHRLRSTLLHEMCHAAAWLIDGVYKPSHGKCFQKWAQIAMNHVRGIEVTTTHDYQISFKYAWACTAPKCECVIKRHSRSVDVSKHRCGRCQGKLMEIEVPSASNTSTANVVHVPKKKAPPSAYNLFVKENSAHVREQLEAESSGKVPQPEVMKACARLWREQTPSKL